MMKHSTYFFILSSLLEVDSYFVVRLFYFTFNVEKVSIKNSADMDHDGQQINFVCLRC